MLIVFSCSIHKSPIINDKKDGWFSNESDFDLPDVLVNLLNVYNIVRLSSE